MKKSFGHYFKHYLQEIFSIKNKDVHKVVKIFGIKIKFKRKKFKNITNNTISNTEYLSVMPVKELFLQQKRCFDFYNRMDTIVRFLAIENEYGLNNFGWDLYKRMQDKRMGEGFSTDAVIRFKKLIKSWEENGYDEKSYITINQDMKLEDGSHRLALCLFHNLEKVSVMIQQCNHVPLYGINWFVEQDFSSDEIRIIQDKYQEIANKYKDLEISCMLWAPCYPYFDEITEKLKAIYNVQSVEDFDFSDDTYNRMVDAVYRCDDIENWKVEKKKEYMKSFYPKKIRYIKIKFKDPKLRFKQMNHNTILIQGEELKTSFRNCYKDKIKNYFYDILIHTADNSVQTTYIDKLFHPNLNLEQYFSEISQYKWYFVKYETENMTKDFPKTIPFSKDMDIVVSENDYENLVKTTEEFLTKITSNRFELRKIIDSTSHTRLRVELNGFLIYQIDIKYNYEGLNDNFVEESLNRRKELNSFYIPPIEDEICYRITEYITEPEKTHHLDYIKNNIDKADVEIIKKALKDNSVYQFFNISENKLKIKNCKLCGSTNIKIIGKYPDFQDTVTCYCENCGFIYNNLPNNYNVNDCYKKKYRNKRQEHISEGYINNQDYRAAAQKKYIEENIGNVNNKEILEIGCSIASLLKAFDNNGNILTGYEPDIEMSKFASERINGTINCKSFSFDKPIEKKYDLICLSHVFEHFENPQKALEYLKDSINNNGYIFIEIPNNSFNSVRYSCNNKKGVYHLSFFNPKTFKEFITKYSTLKIQDISTFSLTLEDYYDAIEKNKPFKDDRFFKRDDEKGLYIRCLLKKEG